MAKRLILSLNRVLIEKIVPPSKTNAGILLPEKSSKLNSGKVVAIGPGTRDKAGNLISVAVKEGDTVLLPEYGGTEVKLGDKEGCKVGGFERLCPAVLPHLQKGVRPGKLRLSLLLPLFVGASATLVGSHFGQLCLSTAFLSLGSCIILTRICPIGRCSTFQICVLGIGSDCFHS
ncbi:hypothetical protein L6164_008514 [Bauhinia variegata]|uniref:Uncharacterized protein n=1 Tax=Bauhinia variegata TaxID=167791 RepID=A0ACB9PJS9_BAUVA|nr:hypothetical protein L6164_008514 [Bauhinia variegata]